MDLKKLLGLLLGNHKGSTIYGVILAALYGTIGGQENAVTNPKTLIVSALILLVGRLIPAEKQASEPLAINAASALYDNPAAVSYERKLEEQADEYAVRNAKIMGELADNQAQRKEVNDETTERLDNLRHRPAPDRLRGDV
jgi:hypothetical protein